MRVPPGCSPVVAYRWHDGDDNLLAEVDALDYWPLFPGTEKIEGRSYIVCAPHWREFSSPTHERLENGEVRAMPKSRWSGGGVYFNRSRKAQVRAASSE